VSDDRITCVYYAADAELIREHARRGGFPCDVIELVHTTIDPTTASPLAWTTARAADRRATHEEEHS
jgi:hypothetical protein